MTGRTPVDPHATERGSSTERVVARSLETVRPMPMPFA